MGQKERKNTETCESSPMSGRRKIFLGGLVAGADEEEVEFRRTGD